MDIYYPEFSNDQIFILKNSKKHRDFLNTEKSKNMQKKPWVKARKHGIFELPGVLR